jgi:hypothetical protein
MHDAAATAVVIGTETSSAIAPISVATIGRAARA